MTYPQAQLSRDVTQTIRTAHLLLQTLDIDPHDSSG